MQPKKKVPRKRPIKKSPGQTPWQIALDHVGSHRAAAARDAAAFLAGRQAEHIDAVESPGWRFDVREYEEDKKTVSTDWAANSPQGAYKVLQNVAPVLGKIG